MKTLKNWVFRHQSADHVELLVDDKHVFRLYVLEPMLARVLVKQHGELKLNRTWSIAPQQDVPWQGRSRESSDGFSLPVFTGNAGRCAAYQHYTDAHYDSSAAVAGVGILR